MLILGLEEAEGQGSYHQVCELSFQINLRTTTLGTWDAIWNCEGIMTFPMRDTGPNRPMLPMQKVLRKGSNKENFVAMR